MLVLKKEVKVMPARGGGNRGWSQAQRERLWGAVRRGEALRAEEYGYDTASSFEKQLSWMRELISAADDPAHSEHEQSLDMRDWWFSGVLGNSHFIEIHRKCDLQHWYELCEEIIDANLSAAKLHERLRVRRSIHKSNVVMRRRKGASSDQSSNEVDYKSMFRQAEAKVTSLESEIVNLRTKLVNIAKICRS